MMAEVAIFDDVSVRLILAETLANRGLLGVCCRSHQHYPLRCVIFRSGRPGQAAVHFRGGICSRGVLLCRGGGWGLVGVPGVHPRPLELFELLDIPELVIVYSDRWRQNAGFNPAVQRFCANAVSLGDLL